jgi:hypothetical protein
VQLLPLLVKLHTALLFFLVCWCRPSVLEVELEKLLRQVKVAAPKVEDRLRGNKLLLLRDHVRVRTGDRLLLTARPVCEEGSAFLLLLVVVLLRSRVRGRLSVSSIRVGVRYASTLHDGRRTERLHLHLLLHLLPL